MTLQTQKTHLKILRRLEGNPNVTQCELAEVLGINLGITNFCLRALVKRGIVNDKNFKSRANKRAYLYILKPKGIEAKARISVSFPQRKIVEHKALKKGIEQLKSELEMDGGRYVQ